MFVPKTGERIYSMKCFILVPTVIFNEMYYFNDKIYYITSIMSQLSNLNVNVTTNI